MSEVDKDPSGMPISDASGAGGNTDAAEGTDASGAGSRKNSVAYETYQKALRQEKAAKQIAEQAIAKAELLEQEKLAAEGKTQELYEAAKKRAEESEAKRKSDASRFIQATLHAQLEAKAMEYGCIDREALLKFANLEALVDEVDIDTFRAPDDKVSAEIDRIKQAKSYLFQNKTPSIDTKLPSTSLKIDEDYAAALSKCKTQAQLDAVRQKYGRS